MILTRTELSSLEVADFTTFDSGYEAVFTTIGNVGVKLYQTRKARDFAYKLQKKAHELEIGPEVGTKFSIQKNGFRWHGYTTQIAGKPSYEEYEEHIVELENKASQIMSTGDLAQSNCGMINGKLVVIDFGPYSSGSEDC